MKFGKTIRAVVDQSYEEWRPMFMSYKDLKKILSASLACSTPHSSEDHTNHSHSNDSTTQTPSSKPLSTPLSPQNAQHTAQNGNKVRTAEIANSEFFTRFRSEVEKVNEFFLDKQEDYIIEHQQLTAKMNQLLQPPAPTRQQIIHLRQRLTNFHGQLIVLENFSTVNYTGFRKILKKHDKKTGLNMRNIYLKTVLITPFFLSNTVPHLIRTTEAQLAQLDSVRKFRRSAPTYSVATDTITRSSPASVSLSHVTPKPTPPTSMRTPPSAPSAPPRPYAFISPRSALWRLYRESRLYSLRVSEALQSSQPCVPPPPQTIAQLLDSVHPSELGIRASFVAAVPTACDYRIATDVNFAMGFFVIGPDTQLQLFNLRGVALTRNMLGKARLRCFETVDSAPRSNQTEQPADSEDHVQSFAVRETRSGMTTGPWPAVSVRENTHVQWTPETQCAVFYVVTPANAVERLPQYRLQPMQSSSQHNVYEDNNSWPITQVFS
ncbi:SPX domain-containing protein 4 [Gracilariopsis chorda]|uniref:SPX domain-containing protein 4 n=1 Tax=Gracilariopsis chorda TaxID=448386 RepID=A0A2V3IU35_9FLOR|nr:SPX domain-containing protein 4 [Gracilariopsis chorda]|eukprot:PXF44630.1 SPX domain-containing protein 4 [Gracilariopsis chorda]